MPPAYPRYIETRIRAALADTPAILVNGPRQSGKTFLLHQLKGPKRTYMTLDDPNTLASARHDPAGLIATLDHVAIDEIQRAPDLLRVIKKSIDDDRRPGRFLLSGSANILTLRTASESLAGRMEVIPLWPLSRSEILASGQSTFLKHAFSGSVPRATEHMSASEFLKIVLLGGYPEAIGRVATVRRQAWFKAYVNALLERDIQDIAAVYHPEKLPRLIQALAHHSGQLVNLAEMGGQIGLDAKTVGAYMDILKKLFLLHPVQPWHRNALKRLVKTPKLHFVDSGLLASLRGVTAERAAADRTMFGPIVETFVYTELLKMSEWHENALQFFHYRDKDQVEVDLVIENAENKLIGIEVKSGATVDMADFKGLRRLADIAGKDFKLGVVLYQGTEALPFGPGLWAAPLTSLWSPRRRKET